MDPAVELRAAKLREKRAREKAKQEEEIRIQAEQEARIREERDPPNAINVSGFTGDESEMLNGEYKQAFSDGDEEAKLRYATQDGASLHKEDGLWIFKFVDSADDTTMISMQCFSDDLTAWKRLH